MNIFVWFLFSFLCLSNGTPVAENKQTAVDGSLVAEPSTEQHLRLKRQNEAEVPVEPNCNFGTGINRNLCQWQNMTRNHEKWITSKGADFKWIGGPPQDRTGPSLDGGYALYETSKLVNREFSQSLAFDSAMLLSPILEGTKAIGTCIDFWYAIDGLSQDRLRILLRPPTPQLEKINFFNMTQAQLREAFELSDGRDDIVLWEHKDSTNGKWINGQAVYSFINKHMIIFEGLPLSVSDPNRAYRGFIAMDDFKLLDGTECKPFCNFEGGFCSWSQDNVDDEFDWELSRGSINPSTGPPMDRFSFNYGIKGGGYAYINAGYPRRPADKARLKSEVFSPPEVDSPLCMRFWTHMFGNGVGILRIILSPTQGEEEVIWELKGEQGNNWYQGQVTITAFSEFQIVIEAEVGENNLGDIAIDEIALKENACPTSPQSASKKGDCTFEVDVCGWRNIDQRQRMDELDWERTVGSESRAPNMDHTLKSPLGSYITLPRNSVQRGERGWLMSSALDPTEDKFLCLSFWYFMYDPFIEQTGPSLGSLRVMMMEQDTQGFQTLTTLWELRNHQGPSWQYGQTNIQTKKTYMLIFEGLWGNARGSEYMALDDFTFFNGECTTKPTKATSHKLNCDFTRDSCAYSNATAAGRGDRWFTSTISRRPSTLADHTYGGPVGYVYFDMFNRGTNDPPKLTMMSSVVEKTENNEPLCLTFWFAPIGDDAKTFLTVQRETADIQSGSQESNAVPVQLWRMPASEVYKDRIEWMFGQVQIDGRDNFKIAFVGEAIKGGFALDDIQIYPGECTRRPLESDPALQNQDA